VQPSRGFRAFFNTKNWPAWLLGLYSAFTFIPDFKRRLTFWLDAASAAESHFKMVETILLSPYFSSGLFAASALYIILVGQPKNGLLKSSFLIIAAWIASAGLITVVVGAAAYGALQIEINRLANQKVDAFFSDKLDTTQKTNGTMPGVSSHPTFALGQPPHFTEQSWQYFSKILLQKSPILSRQIMDPYIGMSMRFQGKIASMTADSTLIMIGVMSSNAILICQFSMQYENELSRYSNNSQISGYGTIANTIGQALVLTNCQPEKQ
jgi:hypothetical protein